MNNFLVLRNDIISTFKDDDLTRWNAIVEKIKVSKLDVVLGRNKIPVEGGVAPVIAVVIYKNKSIVLQTYAPSEYLMLKTFEDFFTNYTIEEY